MIKSSRDLVPVIFRCLRCLSDTSIKIPSDEGPSSQVEHNGWVQKAQKCGTNVFLHISDGLSPETVQVVVPRELCRSVPVGSAVHISGSWQASSGTQQEKEILANLCEVFATDADPRYSTLSADQLRKKVHLRTRSPWFSALLRLRSKLLFITHDYFVSRGYIHIDTPIFTTNDCEGAGETFTISSPSKDDFFAKKDTFLSVSGQLHLEAMVSRQVNELPLIQDFAALSLSVEALVTEKDCIPAFFNSRPLVYGISRVYTVSTGCRADKQQSRNHLTEFRMLEAEIAFCKDLNNLMDVPEDFLKYCIHRLLNSSDMFKDFESLGPYSSKNHLTDLQSILDSAPFPRLTYSEVLKLLASKGQEVTGSGLNKLHEAFLVQYHNSPVFVTHFPTGQKPFYMLRSSDGETTECFDFLCPGVCELAGGSIREPSGEALRERNSSVEWYAEIRERGKPISGGFGMGFERLLQLLLGVQNIKDTVPFPRWFKHCQC